MSTGVRQLHSPARSGTGVIGLTGDGERGHPAADHLESGPLVGPDRIGVARGLGDHAGRRELADIGTRCGDGGRLSSCGDERLGGDALGGEAALLGILLGHVGDLEGVTITLARGGVVQLMGLQLGPPWRRGRARGHGRGGSGDGQRQGKGGGAAYA